MKAIWPGIVVGIPMVAFVAFHLAWWGFGMRLPSPSFCRAAARLQQELMRKGVTLFRSPKFSRATLFAALCWTPMVILNLLLLSEAAEAFFPQGRPISMGWLGTYRSGGLAAGGLFAVTAMSFGVILTTSNAKLLRALYAWQLVFICLVEAGLVHYHASLLAQGRAPSAATAMSTVLVRTGPWFALFFGFLLPFMVFVVGNVVIPGFVLPASRYSLRCLQGLSLLISAALCFAYFGFHTHVSIPVPQSNIDPHGAMQGGEGQPAKFRDETGGDIATSQRQATRPQRGLGTPTTSVHDIFISYRRDGGEHLAGRVKDALGRKGYSVFMDVEDLKSGLFDEALLGKIEEATDVIVVLTPGCLNRCVNEGDWLRREIAHAIASKRNVVPVMARNFEMPAHESLPADIAALPRFNGVTPAHELFDASIDRLASRFLKSVASRE